MREDEMVGWHHRLNGHEFEETPADGEGQGSLACCGSWGHKELDTTERLNGSSMVCRKMPLQADHALILRTCESATLHCKRTLEWGDYSGLSRQVQSNPMSLNLKV